MAQQDIECCVGWGPWPDEPFGAFIQEHCAARKLSCVLCKDANVGRIIRAVETGRTRVLFHLDLEADYDDPEDQYGRLGFAAHDSGAFVVNEPDHAKLGANKAILHYRLERFGVPVPHTVVVRNWEPGDFKLTPAERAKLGCPFIIKPARGYGKQGVARVQGGSVREIARARRFDRGDDFLLQELVEPEWFGHHMGWFRALYVLGQVILCWWDTVTEHYCPVTIDQFRDHGLAPLADIVWKIAQATHMNYFSTELAIAAGGRGSGGRGSGGRRFLSIDYVNDPCDMTLQTQTHCGVPDRVVQHVAERLVEAAWNVKEGLAASEGSSIWFPNGT